MKKYIFITFLFIQTFSFAQDKIVKRITETQVTKRKILFFNKKVKRKQSFTEYNKAGQEIAWGFYGESYCIKSKLIKGKDSSISFTLYHVVKYKNIKCEDFSFYDSLSHRLIKKETWYYHNNKKDYLSTITHYLYNNKRELIKEKRMTVIDSNKVDNTITYYYNEKGYNTKQIDSNFFNYGDNKVSILLTRNCFDWKNRILQTTEYSDNTFLFNKKYVYNNGDSNIIWVFRYEDEKNDTTPKLWSISTTIYGNVYSTSWDDIFPLQSDWKMLEYIYRTMDNVLNERSVYLYNKYGLIDRIKYQDGSYDKYTYAFY